MIMACGIFARIHALCFTQHANLHSSALKCICCMLQLGSVLHRKVILRARYNILGGAMAGYMYRRVNSMDCASNNQQSDDSDYSVML